MFDPNAFLEQVVTEVGSTESTPIPAGVSTSLSSTRRSSPPGRRRTTRASWVEVKITWALEDQAVRDLLGRDKVIVAQDIMLDIIDTGSLDMGKGRTWNSTASAPQSISTSPAPPTSSTAAWPGGDGEADRQERPEQVLRAGEGRRPRVRLGQFLNRPFGGI